MYILYTYIHLYVYLAHICIIFHILFLFTAALLQRETRNILLHHLLEQDSNK